MERPRPQLPEELLMSRQAGWFSADRLRWLDKYEHDEQIGLSLLTFPEGNIFIAAAGTPILNKISKETREKTTWKNVNYALDDILFLRAARLKAAGIVESDYFSRQHSTLDIYEDFTIEGLRTQKGPNAHRIYFASTTIDKLEPELSLLQEVEPTTPAIIRLVVTDKQNQIKALQQFSGEAQRTMKGRGKVGSI